MHIKSIILEGFKSYAQRTEVNGFDPLFNAITGLNGSGKSNILDSICFLLGISNLSQVRASNLQDLVYKNGQAGITKASVSITFDNSDKKQSPLGFEVHDEITVTRQVVIGGRNKYLINGVNANNTRVQDLFCSVGLNVNNPHFLIMQILSMIEEAAGTRMYEYKKLAAQKTIEKKEAKLKEIKTILEEEITPTIQKLKEERSSYLEYQKIMREIEHLSRLYIAYQFLLAEDTKERSAEELKEMQDKVAKLQEELSENDKKIKALNHEIEELEKRKDKEIGGILRSLEDTLAEAQRVNTKSQSAFDLKKKNLTSEENKRKELEKNMAEDSKTLAAKEKEVKKITDGLHALQEASHKDTEALAAAQQHFNAVSAGLSSNEDGAEATFAGQMMACKNDISKAQTEAKQDSKTLAAKEKEVKKITDGLHALQEASHKDTEALAAAQQHFNAVSAGLSSNEDGAEATFAGQMMACKNDISKAQTEAKQAQMKLKHAQQELKNKQAEVKKMNNGYRKDQEAFRYRIKNKVKKAVNRLKEKLEVEMKKLNYKENKEESLLEKRRQLSRDISRLKETYEALLARFPNLQFAYKDPEKNWNKNCVKGLVASLISVKDSSATTALELVAGERLYNVVVDTEVTGKKLLEKGDLKRRYTIIPLNKISARCIAPETLRIAQNLVGSDNVHVALYLVDYKPELQKAMEFVFGTTLVCDNMDNAKKVAFDKRIMTRTVTLGGDVFDPRGTLSGGARSQAASILTKFQELKDVQEELRIKENELRALEEELAGLKNTAEKYHQLKQQWEMKTEEADLLQTKLQQSSYHKQQEELDALKKTIEECEATLRNTEEIQKKAEEKYKVLENKMKNAEAEREKELKDAQKKLDCAKTKADASSKKMKEKQQEVEAITLELEELRREHISYKQQLEAVNEAIKSYEGQIEVMAAEVAKNKEVEAITLELEELRREHISYKQQLEAVNEAIKSYEGQIEVMAAEVAKNKESANKAQEEVAKQKEVIIAQDNIIKAKYAEVAKHKEQNNDSQLKIKELDHNISKHKRETEDAAAKATLCSFFKIIKL
ncbi:Structural maintenance of chromosomes protein 2 [Tupaia chinensis]|uniref:Structural maintenance of chromosomes protein 2 n=1 Tax=Tupaia chinensis TaxID=246437 RepID=L9K688_TUPCH|nr:Structural maintenance of chromosomes protein 2 [Tupaia chinensis]